jgi:hypothetical protein
MRFFVPSAGWRIGTQNDIGVGGTGRSPLKAAGAGAPALLAAWGGPGMPGPYHGRAAIEAAPTSGDGKGMGWKL